MSIKFRCPECGESYTVGDDKAGCGFECRSCGERVRVPQRKRTPRARAQSQTTDPWDAEDLYADDEPQSAPAALPSRRRSSSSGAKSGKQSSGKKKTGSIWTDKDNPIVNGIWGILLIVSGVLIVGGSIYFRVQNNVRRRSAGGMVFTGFAFVGSMMVFTGISLLRKKD